MNMKQPSQIGFICIFMMIAGCGTPKPTQQELQTGLIVSFPGVFGGDWAMAESRRAYRDAGVKSAIISFDYQRIPFISFLDNLMDEDGNRKRALKIANKVSDYRKNYPNTPIDFVGYSGGGPIALMTVEALDNDIKIRNILLVQSAISPKYNLTPALSHTKGNIVNFYCESDWLFLGLGTKIFGTSDRLQSDAAGKVGFDIESAIPNQTDRIKLIEIPWTQESFKETGHLGDHFGMLFYQWNKEMIAPYLLIK